MRWISHRTARSFGTLGTDLYVPIDPVNRLLASCLGGEREVLVDTLEGRREHGYPTGSSLVAVLSVEEGEILPRRKPPSVAPDRHGRDD